MNTVFDLPMSFLACATCKGHPDDPNVIAANIAVLVMLVVLGVVLTGFGKLILFLARAEKLATRPARIIADSRECAPSIR
jgi:hypothetical protein